VTTVRVLRGMETEMSRRLCWRAPRTSMWVSFWRVDGRASAADTGGWTTVVGEIGVDEAKLLVYPFCSPVCFLAVDAGNGSAGDSHPMHFASKSAGSSERETQGEGNRPCHYPVKISSLRVRQVRPEWFWHGNQS
jgi:hypothetical protein